MTTGKRWTGSVYQDIATKKRWTGSAWVDLTIAKRWDGSAWVDIFATAVQPNAPLITTGTSGLKNDDYVDVNWTTNSNLPTTEYQVERATNSGFTTGLTVVKAYHTFAGTNGTHKDTTMAAKTTYYYRVVARNGALTTNSSNTITVTVNLLVPTIEVYTPAFNFMDLYISNRNIGVPNLEYGYRVNSNTILTWDVVTAYEGVGGMPNTATIYVRTRDGIYTTAPVSAPYDGTGVS